MGMPLGMINVEGSISLWEVPALSLVDLDTMREAEEAMKNKSISNLFNDFHISSCLEFLP